MRAAFSFSPFAAAAAAASAYASRSVRAFRSLAPACLVALVVASAACAPAAGDENAVSSADVVVGSSAPTPKSKEKKTKEVDKPLVPIYVDQSTGAPIAPPPSTGPSGSLSIDGNPCTIDKVNLAVPVQSNGWTLTIDAHCPSGVSFQASGVFDAAYPQMGVTAFGSTEAALLTVASDDGSTTDTFNTSSGGDSEIDNGPTSSVQASVSGVANVLDVDTFAGHDVDYAVTF